MTNSTPSHSNSPSPPSAESTLSLAIDNTTNITTNGEVHKFIQMTQAERDKMYSEQEAKVGKLNRECCDPNSPKGFVWKEEYQNEWSAKVDMRHDVFAFNKVRSFQTIKLKQLFCRVVG
jgi:hypothetical protein